MPRYLFPSAATEAVARRVVDGETRINFDRARRVTASVPLPTAADYGDESASHAHKIRAQNAETAPPTFDVFDVGTIAEDRDGDLWELREFRIGDSLLREMEHPGRYTVDKYVQWIRDGYDPPPIRVMESEKGSYTVNDGHHRIASLRAAGRKTVKAWVALTINRVINEDGPIVMPEGLSLDRARAALNR